jgi:hypothetical protein
MARTNKLMIRNGGFEDRVTMMKLGAGKRWDVSRHNTEKCILCEEVFSDQRHAMMSCTAIEVFNARELWKKNIRGLIEKASMNLRIAMDDYYRNVFGKLDGEMAAVGTYTVRWVKGLDKNRRFNHYEWKAMLGLMKAVAQGARGLMRVYTKACCDKTRDVGKLAKSYARALELRQLSINEFVGQNIINKSDRKLDKEKKKKGKQTLPEKICAPPTGTLEDIERGGLG